ncbi:MAG TPA: hypothetical protein GXX51_04540 [Firmicutes bacterium]|nr:hypothetical protein [Bacillota bacterium]
MPAKATPGGVGFVPGNIDIHEIEGVLSQLPGVESVRIVVDADRRITEIHGLANPSRPPKQIIRDIESSLMAGWGIRVDHKKIGIAQVRDEPEQERQASFERRLKIKKVDLSVTGLTSEAEVELELEDKVYLGRAAGGASSGNNRRLVAMATLGAVEAFLRSKISLVLDELIVTTISGRKVVIVSVSALSPVGEEVLVGSALVDAAESEAIARATMDSINRRIAMFKNSA